MIWGLSRQGEGSSKNIFQRHHRQIPLFPERNEKTAAYCGTHEYHVICGPEKYCDKSCDNIYR